MDQLQPLARRLAAALPAGARAPSPGGAAAGALAALLLLRALAALARWVRISRGLRGVPVAPGGHWLVGHLGPLWPWKAASPWDTMSDWCAGGLPAVRFRLFQRSGVVLGDPHALRRVFQTRWKAYDKDLDFSYKPFLPILGGGDTAGLVTANGAHWQSQRLLMAPAMRVDMLDAIIPIAARAVERLAAKLEPRRGTGAAVDVEEEMRLLTLQVIGEAILSLPPEECDAVFPRLYLPVMDESNRRVLEAWRPFLPLPAWRHAARVRQLDAYLAGVIRRRRASRRSASSASLASLGGGGGGDANEGRGLAGRGDILDRILAALEDAGAPWSPRAERQLVFEIKTFLLAGHETSAAMLTWALYELAGAPERAARVRAEAAAALGLPRGAPAGALAAAPPPRAAVDGMDFTLAVLKETLRKYSVVPIVARTLNADDEVCGHALPRGAWVVLHLQRVHHHHTWDAPGEWRPERFLPGGEYDRFDEAVRPYMFVPFIQGPRNCLGQYFALLEARVVLGALAARFRFECVDAKRQGAKGSQVPVGPRHGMPMRVF